MLLNYYDAMRLSQLEFIKTCLKAFPVLTTMGGAMAGWLSSSGLENMDIDTDAFWKVCEDTGIGAALGLLGGTALSCFGMGATYYIRITYTVEERRKLGLSLPDDITPTTIHTFFDKNDVADNNKSVRKTADKRKAKADAEALERSKILKHGTEELERQRKEKLGIVKPGTKSQVKSDVRKH